MGDEEAIWLNISYHQGPIFGFVARSQMLVIILKMQLSFHRHIKADHTRTNDQSMSFMN